MADTQTQASSPTECWMYALYEAIAKDQSTMSDQQIADSNTAMIDVQMEENLYNHWNEQLQKDSEKVTEAANEKPNKSGDNPDLTKAQTQYSTDSTLAQGYESQADGNVQSAQGQVSADAQNLQQKATMASAMNSIQQTLTSFLGRITA